MIRELTEEGVRLVTSMTDPDWVPIMKQASGIVKAHAANTYVGICGQAPSDYPEFAAFLVRQGIDSMSLNPDSVVKVKRRVAKVERS